MTEPARRPTHGRGRAAGRPSTKNILAAGKRAGVRHHVLMSIVGLDLITGNAHYAGRRAQEALVSAGEAFLPPPGARLAPMTFDAWLLGQRPS